MLLREKRNRLRDGRAGEKVDFIANRVAMCDKPGHGCAHFLVAHTVQRLGHPPCWGCHHPDSSDLQSVSLIEVGDTICTGKAPCWTRCPSARFARGASRACSVSATQHMDKPLHEWSMLGIVVCAAVVYLHRREENRGRQQREVFLPIAENWAAVLECNLSQQGSGFSVGRCASLKRGGGVQHRRHPPLASDFQRRILGMTWCGVNYTADGTGGKH